jgi:hypothetical protein
MARTLSQGKKAGLIFAAAVLASFLIVRKAEGKTLKSLIFKDKTPVKLPPVAQVKQEGTAQPPPPTKAIEAKADPKAIKQCDPLVVPPEGMGCFEVGGGVFALLPSVQGVAQADPNDAIAPDPGPYDISLSNDLSSYKIGRFFILKTLWPYLDNLREAGKLETREREPLWDSLTQFAWSDPAKWLAEDMGAPEILGYAAMAALYITAGGGAAAIAASSVSLALIGSIPLAVGTKYSAVISGLAVGANWAGTLAYGTVGVSLATDLLFYPFNSGSEEDKAVLISQYSALTAFMEDYSAQYGAHGPLRLSAIPYADKPAMEDLIEEIRLAIHEFQQRMFTWPGDENLLSWMYE